MVILCDACGTRIKYRDLRKAEPERVEGVTSYEYDLCVNCYKKWQLTREKAGLDLLHSMMQFP